MTLKMEDCLEMYRLMLRIRYFEEKIVEVYAQGLMPGLAHLYIGEEAVAVGVCSALRPEDMITSTHRGHGHCIAKGGDVRRMMAEMFGKSTGYCCGKGGSMHISDIELGIVGANGVVGGGIPLATGAALSAQLRNSDQVVACFFGDGASNQGSFHEALNLAAVWRLPVIYVCENNHYGISVSQERHQAIKDIAVRAGAYGMPGVTVDGNDVEAVYEATREAVARARQGEGPTLLECKTYRWRGHHEGDPNRGTRYRTREEMAAWEKRCPIKNYETKLMARGVSPDQLEELQRQVKKEIDDAVEYANNSPFPTVEEAVSQVYAD
ncbi:pyruvate/2-oxoglutarate dehydrogenase complex, dehydrogenase (E1) component, eukaryotic type, alpha subunit [Moorella thermoacetica Y72]|uniref:Pyruvate/2-oxoglutarate dehydrogenase complex, dehydrogenase (E1) component, eukaryotic type, alpha subunit n=2 Tax=Neomoorella thermoacetica TaxID=1525 RepID=A0A0S6UCC3_NEOTH|nr:thiamine pyrophosphate-dependent dehydrogenase E1 component subunit alpha [Moorella thermoacetica]GAF24992.1 pyruvate/2-oxoglutarate dehydrogenase complex, dehydrogenase (E1) component, eukaryotic type, alpha subunit [Moorella thermoacetica Y72]